MKISFNPSNSNKNILDLIKNNKDIIFDLKGHSIFARGVEFKGTDTNTWRPVVDNLTSDSTTSSLSAKQGKVLKALIDGKSNSDHNHDGRYVRYYAVTTLDCNNLAAGLTSARISATNAAHTNHSAYLYISDVGTPFQIQIPDSSIPYIYKRYYGSGKWSGWFKLNAGYADSAGSVAWANVTGKPSSYTPSAHTHAWNSLTHSSTTENQAILTNGKANGWKLQTLNIARWDNAANNAHSHANKSVLDGITSALVNSWNTAYNFVSNITGTDTDKVINKWEEIVNFLAGITEDNKLNTLLNSKLSIQQLSAKDILTTKTNNALFWVDTKGNASTITTGPFTDHPYALLSVTNYNQNAENHKFFYRSRLAFSSAGDIKVASCHHEFEYQQDETWYNVLTSKNSGINGSTIKLNGTSITVYSSGTADGRYVKKSGDTMQGVLTIDTTNFGALTIKRNDDANGASIQFRGKSSVYGYIGLNNSTKDKQFLRWSSDTSRIYTILDTSSTYISNGKGVINGTTITQVDNATNSTNSTNARKLVNWYSARPTSLNAQFGDGSLRIFYATSSTTEGKPAEDSHILHLAWDNTGGFDAQLAVHAHSGKVSTRAQNGGTWQPWKTLAFITDIPTSLKNPYSFNVFGVVYDGSAAKTVTTSNFISQVNEGTSTITDGTMLITSYASNSGFADTNAVNVPYKRKAIHLWEYIKAKTDSLYATKVHNHDGIYVRAFRTSNDNIDSDWGQSFKTFDPVPLGTPPEQNPNISLLSIGENFNRRKQLAFIWNNDNIYYRRRIDSGFTNWRRLAFVDQIPTSLKNPHALTISLNGTSQGPYDGSAAKNINITPGSIGAAVSNHSHDYLVVNSADDKSFNSAYHNFQVLYAGGGNGITGKPANVDAFGLFKFRAASGWSGQMLLANGGSLYIRSSEDAKMTNTLAWKTILDSSNYSGILDSRYYTESEVNSLLDAKLNRQNLSYGTWNPRGYHLAADYHYNGGDLSISENNGKMYVSVDGCFWQNEGQYRVLDTSDIGDIRDSVTLHQYLSATDAAWYPLVWGGNAHKNTSDSTGVVYKSYDKLSWQTSSQTLYATNIQTNNIKNLSIGGGIYWNPNVESASDGSDAASITLVRSGVAGGTTLVLSQMNDTNDTIQFKTNTAARLYHNSYPILTTQNTYVNNNKGYINGTEITQVNNSDTLDGAHLSDIKNWSDRTASAYWKAGWYKVASAQTATNTEAFLTLDVNAAQSKGHATLFIRKRADSKPYFICTHNNNLNLADFRLYYNGMSMVLYARVPNDWNGRVFRIISEGREGTYEHIWTLYSNASSTDPNAISAEGENPYINPTYSGRVDWSNSSDKANYANSAGSVAWANVTNKPSTFNPAAHTHTVFKNNLMIKGTNGISDSASIHLGIGDSDTGFKWISDGVCQIYANNVAVGQWTSGGMNWFKNPTVNGNKVWNAGNDGSGSGLDADTLDGYHAASFVKMKQFRFNQYKEGFWTKILTITINSTSDLQPVIAFNWIPSECAREVWAEFTINWRSNSPIFYAIWKGTAVRTLTCVNSSGNIWNVWVQGDKNSYDPFGEVQVTYAHNISSYNGGSLGYSDSDPGGTRCTLGGYVNYARSTGNADTVDGQHASAFSYKSWWHWYGKDGQPNWLWGGNNENDYYVYNPSNFRVAYAASAGNADTLDGYPANGSNDRPYGHIPTIESDGVMEVGRYIDFHNDNNGKHDFSTRLQSTGNYGNEVNLPSASGTLALINDVNNYYWANVKISASSSTTTSPTVSNLTATSSIRMSNISLEHTDEINNITNGGIHLNYRNSGNVNLCYGGGNVGIGTNSPTQKLDVIGNIRATGQLYLPTNGNYNAILMGDDCWMGDCNISNVIGLSGTNNANSGGIKFGKGGMYIGYNGSSHYSSGTSLWTNFNADTVDGEHASNFSYTHQSSFDFSKRKSGRIVTFDQSGTDYGWINGFASTHNNYLTSVIFNEHRSSNWYVGYMEGDMSTGETNGLQAVHKLAFADGDESYPIFLGYLNLFNGNDGTISSSFPCLGYSVPFTYTRGGAYCLINIPNTSFQTFYIKAAIASVHYSGAGMGHWVGNHRGDGAWWLHCDAVGSNAVQVKGFHLANENNDSWWGGNPLYSGNGAAKIITVCLFGYVKFR